MKKIATLALCAITAVLLASCGSGSIEQDANGNTPKDIVNQMYTCLQQQDSASVLAAVELCNLPETVTYLPYGEKDKDKKVTVKDNHENVYQYMLAQIVSPNNKTIKSWEITKEEADSADPNIASVKARVTFVCKGQESTVDVSFPFKRIDNVWKING